jgi:hypothetical protein
MLHACAARFVTVVFREKFGGLGSTSVGPAWLVQCDSSGLITIIHLLVLLTRKGWLHACNDRSSVYIFPAWCM